jgi:type IV pilus assembly protein PilO
MAAAKGSAPAQGGSTLDRLPVVGKVLVGALFTVLIGLLYFVIFYSDVDNDLTQAARAKSQLLTQLADAKKSREEFQKDADEKARLEAQSQQHKKALPDAAETPNVLSSIQDVATISGVNLTSWSPIEEVPMEYYAKVPMKLTLSGKFHQVLKFFDGVTKQERIINVEDIKLKKTKDGSDVEVDCLATAFRAVHPGEGGRKRGTGK